VRNTLDVAKYLLGKELVHIIEKQITSGLIVEVEAYIGPGDSASHAYQGKRTPRTRIQYEIGGKAYVYQIYGLHYCFNVVTQKEDLPEVVLVRALQPLQGVEIMEKRRSFKNNNRFELTNGPGKLCQAMAIDKSCYGVDLCGSKLYIREAKVKIPKHIAVSKRINIEYARNAKNFPWRFYLKNNLYVSKP